MIKSFRILNDIEINAIGTVLKEDDLFNLKALYYDFETDEEMVVVEIPLAENSSVCLAIQKNKGWIVN